MRFYLYLTATVFGLLAIMHVWRMIAESPALAKDPFFLILTVISVGLCIWAVRLLIIDRRRTPSA